ncbi:MAG: hypothetical protein FIA97_15470 [Methylococcaceae bacterium]|nr:hypothetical protein [Methylococcaceae bacterium]
MKSIKVPAQIVTFVAAMLLVQAASASNIYYNTSQAYASNIVSDNNVGQDGIASTPLFNSQSEFIGYQPSTSFAGWNASTSPLPFGFNNERLNWAVDITSTSDTLTVSSQDAHNRYGIWGDIDTAKGAWFDGKSTGWEHQTEVGLIRSSVDAVVDINITGLAYPVTGGAWTNFGVSIYSGMPEGQWKMHGGWNCPSCEVTLPDGTIYKSAANFQDDSPLSASGMTYIKHDEMVDSVNSISFNARAGVVYTILLGGNSGGSYLNPKEGYALNITTAPVPVPAAFWLFGSALVSFIGGARKKRRTL